MSVLAAWRFVLKRASADGTVAAAAFATVLVAATLLAAAPIYGDAVALSGLRRAVADAPVTKANVEVAARLDEPAYADVDRRVTRIVGDAFRATGVAVHRSARSESFVLPGNGDDARELAVLAFFAGIEGRAELVSGRWPRDDGRWVEAALPEPAARLLGLAAGEELVLTSAAGERRSVRIGVVGVYRIADPPAPFWWEEPLALEGVERGGFTTYGPFVVAKDALFAASPTARARWRAVPDVAGLTVDELPALRRSIARLEERLNAAGDEGINFSVSTGLPAILAEAERSLLVARSGVLVPSLQLGVLAAYALLFTAALLSERRALETALLRARGASAGRVAALALAEGLMLAIPAALAAPWLAALALRALNHVGPLAAIDLELTPAVGGEAYLLAALAALVALGALVVPALRPPPPARVGSLSNRPPVRGLAQRASIDLALVALAAVAYWQLRRYRGPLVETLEGRLSVDPFLVAAPALGLAAGALLALRLVPFTARLVERAARAARGAVAALSSWQLARRPGRYGRSALLLVLALAIGVFAAAYGETWIQSQADQATYQAGADIRVRPDERTGAIPLARLAQAYARIDGVETVMPVLRQTLELADAGAAQLVALDGTEAAGIVHLRHDLADEPLPALMRPLAARRPTAAAVPLPGEPAGIALEARLALEPTVLDLGPRDELPEGFLAYERRQLSPSLALVVRDGSGLLHRLLAGDLPADGRPRRLLVDLTEPRAAGDRYTLDYPLSLAALELSVESSFGIDWRGRLVVESLAAARAGRWQPVDPAAGPGWRVEARTMHRLERRPQAGRVEGGDPAVLAYRLATGTPATGGADETVTFTASPARPRRAALAVVASDRFLEATGTDVGEVVEVELAGHRRRVEVTGAVRAFPTVAPGGAGLLVLDLPTYAQLAYAEDGGILKPGEWWIDTTPGLADTVAAHLEAPPFTSAEVVAERARARSLTQDPVALGIVAALSTGFVAATVFAVIGFAVSAGVAARERTTELAVLRALGLSRRQLAGSLAVENVLLLALSLAAGTALGLALAWLVLPFVTLAEAGRQPVPPVAVVVPWRTLAWLELGVLAVLAVVVAVQVRLVRRVPVTAALRLGEDR